MGINKDLLIFVVEDNKMYNHMVTEFLKKQGFNNVESFLYGKDCIKVVKDGARPDIVIQDYFLDDINGIDVLRNVQKYCKKAEFIFLTANENMEVAINSIKYGAYDYIIKDNELSLKNVLNKIGKISRLFELQRRNELIRRAMIISMVILVGIVLFTVLHTFFDFFGLQRF